MALLVPKEVALGRLTRLRGQLDGVASVGSASRDDFTRLNYARRSEVAAIVAEGHEIHSALNSTTHRVLGNHPRGDGVLRAEILVSQARLLDVFIDQVQRDSVPVLAEAVPVKTMALERVLQLLCGFHRAAKQLRQRHDNRPTLNVQDEYDAQDLLHALLQVDFEDVRAEEVTPSYAGNSSRMDFLLKAERLVIELKMTRAGLGNKEVTNQLAIDIERYRAHPDCKTLVCFVYDPAELLSKPAALEHDLSGPRGDLVVKVVVLTR